MLAAKPGGFLVPLQCLMELGGHSLFLETAIDGAADSVSGQNREALRALVIDASKSTAVQDQDGRLWIADALVRRRE
jgi:hypothetical protein